jgi:hypothetical protein
MLINLSSAIRSHIEGKIQENYTAAATLDYSQLIALGIPDCDSKPYKTNNVMAEVAYNYQEIKRQDSSFSQVLSFEEQKNIEWDNYWNWANSMSASQFGQVNIKHFCFHNNECSNNIYYWDKDGNYVTAIEYVRDRRIIRRKVCRAVEANADQMVCTDWLTEEPIRYEYDLLSGKYERSS